MGAVGVVAAAGTGMYAFGQAVADQLDLGGQKLVAFSDAMRRLTGLGDNLRQAGAVRSDVLATSGAYGMSPDTVAQAKYMLQSAAGNLSAGKQGEILKGGIEMSEVAGGDLQTNLVELTKAVQIYGEQLGSTAHAASLLLQIEEDSGYTQPEMAQFYVDTMNASKMMGISIEESGAMVAVTSHATGDAAKNFVALRNIFLKMPEAMEAGYVHAGPLLAKLQELKALGEANPIAFEKMFGERSVSSLVAITQALGDYTKEPHQASRRSR